MSRRDDATKVCQKAHGPSAYAFAFEQDGWWYAFVRDDTHGAPTSNIGKGTTEDASYRDLEMALLTALGEMT